MRRVGLLILSLIVSLSPSVSCGGSYPDRPIRLVVGFGVGGPTDIPARFIADKLSETLGQRVFVENKPASGGIVATRDVIARPADGYTLTFRADQRRRLQRPRLQAQRFGAHFPDRQILLWARCVERDFADRHRLVHRLRQGASRPSKLGHGRLRLSPGDSGAAAGEGHRHHDESGAISRRRATRAGDRRRAH
jgi:hypothetical protein